MAAYAAHRAAVVKTNRRAAIGGGRREVRREGADASLGPQQTAESPKVTVTKFIMLHANHGKDAKLLQRPPEPPAGEPDFDSDNPDGNTPSSDMRQEVLSKLAFCKSILNH